MDSIVDANLYTSLGKSGLKISKIIVGCMSIGDTSFGDWVVADKQKAFDILKKAYDKGIRTYDTADTYSNGASETLLGEFLKEYNIQRETVIILSKVFFYTDPSKPGFSLADNMSLKGNINYLLPNRMGLSRKHIMDAIKGTTERLGTYVDLYQVHRFDPTTPIEETMEALNDVVRSGLARYIGASSMRTYEFIMMQNVAEKHNWTKFISMQNCYNLNYREEEREMIPYCKLTGIGIIPYSPNDKGYLCRPWKMHKPKNSRSMMLNDVFTDAEKETIDRVEELSKKYNVSMSTVALAWLLYKGANPIVGFSKPERIDDALAAVTLQLSSEDIKYLEDAYAVKPFEIVAEQPKD